MYFFQRNRGADDQIAASAIWLGMFMAVSGRNKRWNGWVVGLLGAGSVLGFGNSVLQLGRYGADLSSGFGSADWIMIVIWSVMLVVWALVLGLLSGIAVGRYWYGVTDSVAGGVSTGSMASSDRHV